MERVVLLDEEPARCHDASKALSAAEYQVTQCLELDSAFVCACAVQPGLVIVDDPNHVRGFELTISIGRESRGRLLEHMPGKGHGPPGEPSASMA